MKALIFIRDIFKKYPLLLTASTVLVIFVSLIEACSLFTIGPLIDFLIHPDMQNMSPLTHKVMDVMGYFGISLGIRSYLLIFAMFIILSSSLRILARYWILKAQFTMLLNLVTETFKTFFHTRWYFFSSGRQGVLLNTFLREVGIVGDAFGDIAYLFTNLLQFILYIMIPFYISWQVTTISLLTVFLISCPLGLLGGLSYRLGKRSTDARNRLSSIIQESLGLAKVIMGFGNQENAIRSVSSTYDAYRKIVVKTHTIHTSIPILYRPIGVVVLVVAVLSSRYFRVPLSEMAILLLAMLQAVISVGNLMSRKNSLSNFFPSYEQIMNLKDRAKELEQPTGSKIFRNFTKEILVENISFAYPGHKSVLQNITMRFPKGKMVAIVGESGAGKSTLIDMIMGFNEPIEGQIKFDGVNLWDFDINSYRNRIGYVPQDSILFNTSIKENLLWANGDATNEEIKHACQEANADEFIERFPNKYDTLVGDQGVRLSGGQRQRIALARAIIRKPDLLILDEATSSLDTHSERLIQQAVENIVRETTVIVIAHRLSTITKADYIYVLKDGEVVQEGIYPELINKKGHFESMVKLQLLETGK